MIAVECRGVRRRFASGGGVDSVDLDVAGGERLAIVGPSGAGKSTILRLIAGLERLDAGSILLGGVDVGRLAPSRRGIALALQGQPPFPHLDVAANLGFTLRARGVPAREARDRIRAVAQGLRLSAMLDRRPGTLSGGERQRVVLGRSIAAAAPLTLLDEPFSNLDASLRATIRSDLVELHARVGGTWMIVTHDRDEALAFGDRVAVLAEGRLVQIGSPAELIEAPASAFVASFLAGPGSTQFRGHLEVREDGVRLGGLVLGASWVLPDRLRVVEALRRRGSGPIEFQARPSILADVREEPGLPVHLTLTATIDRVERTTTGVVAVGHLGGQPIRIWEARPIPVSRGDRVSLRVPLESSLWFDPLDGGRRIRGT